MAYDMTFKVGLEPEIDEKSLYKSINKLGEAIRRSKPGTSHASLSRQAGNLVQALVGSGQFTTPAQAERFMRLMSGGNFSAEQMGIWARGTSMARANQRGFVPALYPTFSQRQMARWKPDIASIASQYNTLLNTYASAKLSPTEENKRELLSQIDRIGDAVESIKQTRKDLPATVKKIGKDAKVMSKEVSGWKTSQQVGVTGLGAISDSLKQFFEWAVKLFSAQKIFTTAQMGIERGDKSWIESSMYGSERNVALDRAYANLLQMDEKVFADVQRKAITYRERLKWGQVSAGENYMWARLGLMPLISSGEAGANPQTFMNTFFRALRGKSEQEALSALQTGGLDPSLIYAAKTLPSLGQKRIQDAINVYTENVTEEMYGAMESLPTRSWWGRRGAGLTAGLTMGIANFIASGLSARTFQNLPEAFKGLTYEKYKPVNRALVEGRMPTTAEQLVSTPVVGPLFTEPARRIEAAQDVTQYVTNYVTQNISGADSEDIAEKTVENLNMLNLNSTMGQKAKAN